MSSSNGRDDVPDHTVEETRQLPAWIKQMRAAVRESVSDEDLQAIIQAQVDKAKEGDQKAAKFVLDQLGQLASLKGVKIEQHNHHYHAGGEAGESDGEAQTDESPPACKSERVERMRARYAQGKPVFDEAER